ncbi:HDOD domain-containing protein [candidate division KSB1 bacterium]|nr:HDOD domain-containing protein [candidate division KSB1 bacterium]
MITLATVAADLDQLQPFPAAGHKLVQAVVNPRSSLDEIVRAIEYDPVLTTAVLKLANSAYYAPPAPIETVQDAVMRLGGGRILQFVVGQFTHGSLDVPCAGYDLAEHELWRHSVAAAAAVDYLPRLTTIQIPPASFTGALLHDIGKLVLSRYLTTEIKTQILDVADTEQLTYIEAERKTLGFDHAQIGGVMAKRWGFPDILVECIQRHHDPRADREHSVALDAVHIGNAVAKTLGVGLGSEGLNMKAVAASAEALKLTPVKFEALCAAAADQLESIVSLYEEV